MNYKCLLLSSAVRQLASRSFSSMNTTYPNIALLLICMISIREFQLCALRTQRSAFFTSLHPSRCSWSTTLERSDKRCWCNLSTNLPDSQLTPLYFSWFAFCLSAPSKHPCTFFVSWWLALIALHAFHVCELEKSAFSSSGETCNSVEIEECGNFN